VRFAPIWLSIQALEARERAEVADVVVRRAVPVWLSQPTDRPSDGRGERRNEAADGGDAQKHAPHLRICCAEQQARPPLRRASVPIIAASGVWALDIGHAAPDVLSSQSRAR
jgi:hypothetical protein